MSLITVNQLTKSFDGMILLDHIQFSLNSQDKVAIVGRNGAGKTTLANIICGHLSYEEGNLFIQSNIRLGFFSQESFIDSTATVFEEMENVFSKQVAMKQELEKVSQLISHNKEESQLLKYTLLLHAFEEMGGYTYEYQVEQMLNKFGFKDYYEVPIPHLSGGQRTRLALAKLLLENPDVLILDEPTNHLDIETVEFLEGFLKAYKNAVIIISHDRYFINQVVNQIYEIEFNKGTLYKGNYDAYLRQKEQHYNHLLKQFDIQQKMIQKEQEFIDKNLVRATTSTRAKSRRTKLEKVERLDDPKVDDKSMKVALDFKVNTGNIVLDVNHLTIGYDKPLKEDLTFLIKKNEKVAIIGPNGIGKSTLIKTIYEDIDPLDGEIRYGANVNMAYFDQNLAMLNSNKTVIDELWDEHRMMLEKDVRTLLGTFLFTGEDVFKTISDLSGGEKVRLALAKLVLKKANLLLLDEVTNHLDISSREVLEQAFIEFPGTILFVTHDRYFINELATRIIEITPTSITDYIGNYAYYLEKKAQQIQDKETTLSKNNHAFLEQKRLKSEQKKQQRQIEQIEEQIQNIEQEIETLKASQFDEAVYSNYELALAVKQSLEMNQVKLDALISEWAELTEE